MGERKKEKEALLCNAISTVANSTASMNIKQVSLYMMLSNDSTAVRNVPLSQTAHDKYKICKESKCLSQIYQEIIFLLK